MNKFFKISMLQVFTAAILLVMTHGSFAAGLMNPKNSRYQDLQIKQHHVNVVIEDGYAVTAVEQVFYNPNTTDLEAVYAFPVPEKASVGEFTYWIDGSPVTGEVLEKKEARRVYEAEKTAGRETAITEQDSYKTFDSTVYPVRAQQEVQIRLVYIQPVHIDTGIGRYVYPLEEGGVDEEKVSFWTSNDTVEQAFSFNVTLRSSYPVDMVRLPAHPQAQVTTVSDQQWTATISNQANSAIDDGVIGAQGLVAEHTPVNASKFRLDTDIVVYWRHQQGLPGTVDMVAHKESANGRGTFMLTVTPGEDLSAINQGRDWIFALDISGSMQGKYHSLVEGVNQGLEKLNPADRFRIILFNSNAQELTNGYVAVTAENVKKYSQELERIAPNNGTNLYAGIKKGLKGLDADRSSAIILVTDGVANVGVTEKKGFLELLKNYDVRLFTFVMGNSANRPLLESMAKVSNGFALNVSNSDDIIGMIMSATSKLNHEALRNIKIKFDSVKVKDLTPENIGSLYRGQQLIVFGHYWGDGIARVTINGSISGHSKIYTSEFSFPQIATLNPEIERLWAYAKIEDLQNQMDYLGKDADIKQAIVGVAKEYGLVTDYTSMVVVREEVFQQHNIDRSNQQRVQKEQQARKQRVSQPVRSNRVDEQKPMYSNPRPSYGGGAFGLWALLMFLPLLLANVIKKRPIYS